MKRLLGRLAPSRRTLLACLLVLAAALLSACGEGGGAKQRERSFFAGVAGAHGIVSQDGDGGSVINAAALAQRTVSSAVAETTGGSEEDAALDIEALLDDMITAETLATEGFDQGGEEGLAKIEEAIALQPDDWSHLVRKAVLLQAEAELTEVGGRTVMEDEAKEDEVREAVAGVTERVAEVVNQGGDCITEFRKLYTHLAEAYRIQLEKDPDNPLLQAELAAAENNLNNLEFGEFGLCERD